MQPTRYALLDRPRPLYGSLNHPYKPCEWGASRLRDGCPRSGRRREGREASLDLIEGHLTSVNWESQYRRGSHGGFLLKNWFFPADWNGVSDQNPEKFVLKIQPFEKGGYEATIRLLNLEKIGRAIERDSPGGKREVPEELSVENLEKAAQRAKRKMRLMVKNMGADHLLTLTKREAEGSDYATAEEWAEYWDKFRRMMVRVIGDFPYVAILEKHKKGNYHLHVAWCGRINLGNVRRIWHAALGGGKGCGNIDHQKIKVKSGGDRSARIARYITKYVSKHFETEPRFNKKRYWASRQTLEEARRYILNADTLDQAIVKMHNMLGLDLAKFLLTERKGDFFMFPDGSGLWLNYIHDIHGVPPPF